jgi:DcmR-like sensory protein
MEFGVPGVSVEHGDHICALYMGARERDEVLLPYLRAGLRAGDKCLFIIDGAEPSTVLDGIGEEFDVPACVACEQLDVRSSGDAYLRSGGFSTAEMLDFWGECLASSLGAGRFQFARLGGEMTWALRDALGVDQLVLYESELNRITGNYPQCVLCMYDLSLFGGGIVVDLMRTHPRLLVGGMILDNPYYLSPDEFLATRA